MPSGNFISHNKKRLAKRQPIFVGSYPQLVAAIDIYRAKAGLTHLDVDARALIADGMSSKLAARCRIYTPLTLPLVLEVLGLQLAIVPAKEPESAE